ncbi:Sialic acid TRAP transporter permease protein SiaT [bioreactor metagenome]|uniref:Sialic acid TRAP transporter permease protein SiaT n=1 Tax=bioreactor metagenome TaxID=1076179 RepID=A0A645HIR7_9ZZZZ
MGFGVYKGLTKNKLKESIVDSATSVGAIMSMIVFCLMLSQTFIFLRVPQAIIKIMFGLTENRVVLLILINLLLFLIGMIVNDVTGMVLAAPMLLPLVIELGISPIQFAAIMGVNLAMGGVTPPYASLLYLGMRIGKVEFLDILKPAMTFLCLGYLPVVFLTTFWPDLSLFLPKLAGYIH